VSEQQLTTSADSIESLPIKGYTHDQLKSYILRQLGAPVWNVEMTGQQVIDAINDALALYSQYRPRQIYGAVRLSKTVFEYLEGVDLGLGVVRVDFVDTIPAPSEIFYGNLISPAPIIRTGLDEYDTFLRWRKTWSRVTSVTPDWLHDDEREVLYIYNPLDRYHAGVLAHGVYTKPDSLPHIGAQWVKDYALAKARYIYGDILLKFSGAIPGPVKDIQLDQGKRNEAKEAIEKLEQKLFGMQHTTPVVID
jgi:hypothetical protein